jgi:hypothetical protein
MENRANLSISWKSVAIGAAIVALGALTLAAIVATIKQADTLSVVALGVAVVAFAIQIIVFIVQAAAASEQSLRAQEVYGSTLKVLATIEEKAEGTRQTVSTINDKMLGVLIGKATSEAVASEVSVTSPNFSTEVAERVVDFASRNRDLSEPERGRISDRVPEIKAVTFPRASDLERVLPKITDLEPFGGLSALERLGRDWIKYASDTTYSGLPSISNAKVLYDRGLVRRVRRRWWEDTPVFVLSPDGEIAARILLADDLPLDAPAEAIAIREILQEYIAERAERAAMREDLRIPVEDS